MTETGLRHNRKSLKAELSGVELRLSFAVASLIDSAGHKNKPLLPAHRHSTTIIQTQAY
jgi:hypothetical protein